MREIKNVIFLCRIVFFCYILHRSSPVKSWHKTKKQNKKCFFVCIFEMSVYVLWIFVFYVYNSSKHRKIETFWFFKEYQIVWNGLILKQILILCSELRHPKALTFLNLSEIGLFSNPDELVSYTFISEKTYTQLRCIFTQQLCFLKSILSIFYV